MIKILTFLIALSTNCISENYPTSSTLAVKNDKTAPTNLPFDVKLQIDQLDKNEYEFI